ncbi:hypothetical protein AX16_007947 [Volvariella volvacea WC 439]|nr:hypothetical protein AX16_007947 [Volvariella volvacea WC 439]
MFNLFSLLLSILVFGSQAVHSARFKFKFSEVQQCEPVSITFVGDADLDAVPMTLTVLPFNSNPVVIPIPNAAPNSSGVEVTFLPIAAGTTFIASLDDITGNNSAKVSDIIRVLPSPTNDSTCLPSPSEQQRIFRLSGDVEQCEELTVLYDTQTVSSAPSVRLFNPEGTSFLLELTNDDPAQGAARYMMKFSKRSDVVLLISDGHGNQETSDLLTVLGDSSSDTSCLSKSNGNVNVPEEKAAPTEVDSITGLSQDVIIGLSVGGGIIGIVAICMLIYIIRERRRRPVKIEFNPSMLEKAQPPPSSPSQLQQDARYSPRSDGVESFIQDPPYTHPSYVSAANANIKSPSESTWSQVLPPTEENHVLHPQPDMQLSSSYQARMSINSLDIESILNMAAVHSNRASGNDPTPLGPTLPTATLSPNNLSSSPPKARTLNRPFPTRKHFRDPSDVPHGPNSMLSSLSNNPFSDDNSGSGSHTASRLLISAFRGSASIPPSPAGLTLPVTPRDSGFGTESVVPRRS